MSDDTSSEISVEFCTLFSRLILADHPAKVPGTHSEHGMRCEHPQATSPNLEAHVRCAFFSVRDRRNVLPIRWTCEQQYNESHQCAEAEAEPLSWRSQHAVQKHGAQAEKAASGNIVAGEDRGKEY